MRYTMPDIECDHCILQMVYCEFDESTATIFVVVPCLAYPPSPSSCCCFPTAACGRVAYA